MQFPKASRFSAGAALLGGIILGLAQSGPVFSQARLEPVSMTKMDKDSDVETRIKTLHAQLGITSSQEARWGEVSEVMRDNAREMQEVVEQRRQAGSMTAIDDLKGYEAMADAHSKSLEKLIPAFQKLYDVLSDDQKKKADSVFSESRHRDK